jgi:predicted phage terminase large subunit-like protein
MSWAELFSNDEIQSLNWFGTREQSEASSEGYLEWLQQFHSHVLTAPMGDRHIRLWEWFEALEPGLKPDPRVEIWPRGGAKSSTAEMGVGYVGAKLSRRYCLYVSETQDQADKHVAAVAAILERSGIERSLNKYGQSRGWRRNQLRASNGFNVEALGLDTAARGIKLDEFRPDLIIFDDIDNQNDSAKTTAKKERAIKTGIIPAGSVDCAVLFIQNMIMEDGIVARLYDGRADFLLHRDIPPFEPAVMGLEVQAVDGKDQGGRKTWTIVAGHPTWEGQNLETCEAQINEWGLRSFLRESQHEVAGADGTFFNVAKLLTVKNDGLPRMVNLCRGWDFAATESGGDYTAGILMGLGEDDLVYVLDVAHGQWATENVRKKLLYFASKYREEWGEVIVRIPQDPGQAGKYQAVELSQQLQKVGAKCISLPVNGRKALRARNLQEEMGLGNVRMLESGWNTAFREEFRMFREDESHDHDDMVDGAVDAFGQLKRPAMQIFVI